MKSRSAFESDQMLSDLSPTERRRIQRKRQVLVRVLRDSLDMSQQDLAVALGCAVVTVARWETSHPPSSAACRQIWRIAHDNELFDLANEIEEHCGPMVGLSQLFSLTPALTAVVEAFDAVISNLHVEEAERAAQKMWPILRSAVVVLLKREQTSQDVFAASGRLASVLSEMDSAVAKAASDERSKENKG